MSDKVRHKTFISYHHVDQGEVDEFIRTFDHERDVFIARAVGSDETIETLIDSDDDDYVMRCIREDYLSDSTVTLVFIGKNTWTRKFVDWELAASLHQGPSAGKPNGVIAILSPKLTKAILPDRFVDNWRPGYAKFYSYPSSRTQLAKWIDEALSLVRTRRHVLPLRMDGRSAKRTFRKTCLPIGQASVLSQTDHTLIQRQSRMPWPQLQEHPFRALRDLGHLTSRDETYSGGLPVASVSPSETHSWTGLLRSSWNTRGICLLRQRVTANAHRSALCRRRP